MKAQVLLCGNEFYLLETRKAILEHANFAVFVARQPEDLTKQISKPEIDLAILCHSMSEAEQRRALALLRAKMPAARVLILQGLSSRAIQSDCEYLDALLGPTAFLETARGLTAARQKEEAGEQAATEMLN